MSDKKILRVLFCINVQQTFFDLPFSEIGPVWKAFGAMMKGISDLPGVTILGMLDDDETMVGAVSTGSPYTAYIMADVPDRETVKAACNLFRTIPVGDTDYRLWKYCTVEARMGRPLEVPTTI